MFWNVRSDQFSTDYAFGKLPRIYTGSYFSFDDKIVFPRLQKVSLSIFTEIKKMNQLELAEKIAREAHAGQFRRDGVTPYIKHVEAVVSRCKTEEEKCVAWLHDVIEDTPLSAMDFELAGVDSEITRAVGVLTKLPYQDYESFILYINTKPLARKVKIADILSNLSDSPTDAQIRKYAKALLVLVP